MDQRHFDHLTRDLSQSTTRRGAFRTILALALAAIAGWLPASRTATAATDCCPAHRPRRCGYTCVNLNVDPKNCGHCGHVCGWGTICRHGVCDQATDFTKTAIVAKSQTPTKTKTPTKIPTKTKTPTKIPTKTPSDACHDSVLNGYETDIDCGGPDCPKCADGFACLQASDCQSGVCNGGACQKPTCWDYVKNGDETDIDCGGSSCKKCDTDRACNVASDCVSGACISGKCAKSSCTDGVKNGAETDIDCGGPYCPLCADGKNCNWSGDCKSGYCNGGVCAMNPCTDGVKNFDETDVDCGGPYCSPCAGGKNCALDDDCQSGRCNGGVCWINPCTDGVKNGDETDIDCGGSCAPCANGKTCEEDIDCTSKRCHPSLFTCVPCETAGDCPGLDTECQSRTCTAGICGMNHVAPDTPTSTQITGDCMTFVCDGWGNILLKEDNTDLPAGGPCCTPVCNLGMPGYVYRASTFLCNADSGTYCSGSSCLCV